MKRLKISYLFIDILALLFAVTLWPSIPRLGKADNRIAATQARGGLRVGTIHILPTYDEISGRPLGLDCELAKQFVDYLGVRLKMIVQQNINRLFDDFDDGNAGLLATGLVYNGERVRNYQPSSTHYSVSQQLVYKVDQHHPRTLDNLTAEQLTVAPGHVVVSDLQTLKDAKFPELSWKVDDKKGSVELMKDVIGGRLDYTTADSVVISLFQRAHSELTVTLDITGEQSVIWSSSLDGDNTLSAALLNFFSEVNEDDTLTRTEEKYLGHGDGFDYVDTCILLRAAGAVLPQLKSLFKRYVEGIDRCLLAAITYQGLHWDAQATSPTGVHGIMMLTKNTAQSLGTMNRTSVEQSISGDMRYLQDMMSRVPENVPEDEWIWSALAVCNMGYTHVLDTRILTAKTKDNPDSWTDVKQRLPLLNQRPYYSKLTYGYACGHETYAYVEGIRRYRINLVDYLREKEKQAMEAAV